MTRRVLNLHRRAPRSRVWRRESRAAAEVLAVVWVREVVAQEVVARHMAYASVNLRQDGFSERDCAIAL